MPASTGGSSASRSAGTDTQPSSSPGESMTSHEVGLKNEFFDHRLLLNVDGFYMVWITSNGWPVRHDRRVSSVRIFAAVLGGAGRADDSNKFIVIRNRIGGTRC